MNKRVLWLIMIAVASLSAFGVGMVGETKWYGASDEGFVVKKIDDLYGGVTYYWCCKNLGNGISITGFDTSSGDDECFLPCVYTGTWSEWPSSSQYVGYTYLSLGEIPLEVEGKPLVAIGHDAFVNCGFHSFDIPSTVRSIGASAFYNC